MADPTCEYRGHTIRWSDNEDCWTCWDLSDKVRSSPKLSTIKAHIDKLYLAERKANATPCYELGRERRVESMVVEYLGERKEKSWRKLGEFTITHRVAVVAKRDKNDRPARKEATLPALSPVSPEADAAWQHYAVLAHELKLAERRAAEAFDALPRLKPEDVQKLIDLHNAEKESA